MYLFWADGDLRIHPSGDQTHQLLLGPFLTPPSVPESWLFLCNDKCKQKKPQTCEKIHGSAGSRERTKGSLQKGLFIGGISGICKFKSLVFFEPLNGRILFCFPHFRGSLESLRSVKSPESPWRSLWFSLLMGFLSHSPKLPWIPSRLQVSVENVSR